MTVAFKSTIALSALAVFLGLAAATPAAQAFADQTDRWTYDIDKEDAEMGDYSGWNSGADRMDARSGYDFGRTFGYDRPAGSGQDDGQTPANSGRSGPILSVGSSQPKDRNTFNDRQGTTPRTK
jgi:hypothetical protein